MHWTRQARRRRLFAGALAGFAAVGFSVPNALAQAPPASGAAANRYVVVLDAAHGGNDSGAQFGDGQAEKAVTLALSVRLRSLLTARGFQVVTTRESDAAVDPNRRAEIANRANAQACLSLHASESGNGVHLFVSSMTPVEPGRFAAWRTAQGAWVTRSLTLAGVVNGTLLHAGMNVTLRRTALPAIDSMACPALAIEIAPEHTSGQAAPTRPDSADYQTQVAEALAAALLEWRTEGRQP